MKAKTIKISATPNDPKLTAAFCAWCYPRSMAKLAFPFLADTEHFRQNHSICADCFERITAKRPVDYPWIMILDDPYGGPMTEAEIANVKKWMDGTIKVRGAENIHVHNFRFGG